MSPKGGIMPHKKFSVQSNRSEVLFVDYMAEHLTPNGRAAIIVPEGIIFQSAGAYKQLRKYLIEHNFLWAVVSLPAGAFNPYSGVKTSILFLDKSLAKKTDKVLFVKVENDGFDLGAQRRTIDKNDLPDALNVLQAQKNVVASGAKQSPNNDRVASSQSALLATTSKVLLVSISKLGESGDYNLSADRYRDVIRIGKQTYPLVKLEEVATLYNGRAYKQEELLEDESKTPVLRVGNLFTNNSWYYSDLELDENKYCSAGDLLYAWSASFGPFIWDGPKSIYHYHIWKVEHSDRVEKMFLYHMLKKVTETIKNETHGIAMLHMTKANMEKVEIPLPPLKIQRQLVDEIAAHQRIIDGARQVVEGWKPNFDIDPSWTEMPLGEVITLQRGYDLPKQNWVEGTVPIVGSNGIIGYHNVPKEKGPGVVTGRSGTIGKVHFINGEYYWPHNTSLFVKEFNGHDRMFIKLLLESIDLKSLGANVAAVPSLDRKNAHRIIVSVPPLEIQREIVARIESERAIVEGNRELIRLYEEKVKKVIERVWEG
jgi:type I restriction enzyme M protein